MGVVERATSPSWHGPDPTIAVLVSTYHRPQFLPGLLAALEAQDVPLDEFEVVVVDNGSGDETWARLSEAARTTPLRLRAVRIDANQGPARGRNAGLQELRAPLVAITDDDCLPTAGWLSAMRAALGEPGVDIVQGIVHADPAERDAMGPWDHTKWITVPTPFFETCNVGYSRAAVERVGGFDEDDPLLHPADGRAFGEDACLAWQVQAAGGGARFERGALVHHRCIPGTYRHWLSEQAKVEGFPGLARRSALVDRWLFKRVFLSADTARFDLALGGVVVAAAAKRPWAAFAAVPYLRRRGREARRRAHNRFADTPRIAVQLALGDLVTLASLLRGSLRYRKLVL